jgi:hypothetical protein
MPLDIAPLTDAVPRLREVHQAELVDIVDRRSIDAGFRKAIEAGWLPLAGLAP